MVTLLGLVTLSFDLFTLNKLPYSCY